MDFGEFEGRLRALAQANADRLSTTWHLRTEGVSWVDFSPKRQEACSFSVAWSAHEIVIGFDDTGRIELGPAEPDAAVAIGIAQAVLRGSAFEEIRPGRVWVLLDDGSWIGTAGTRPPSASTMRQYASY